MSGKTIILSCAFDYRASKPNTFKILGLSNENFRNSAMLNNGFIVAAMFGINTHVALLAIICFWGIRYPDCRETQDARCS